MSAVRYGVFPCACDPRNGTIIDVHRFNPALVESRPDGSWPYPYNSSTPMSWSRDRAKAQAALDAAVRLNQEWTT